MSAQSHISVISLAKIGIREKINQIRLAHSMVKHSDSIATTSSETELIEDLPPSYLSTIATQTLSRQDVDETATKEIITEYNNDTVMLLLKFVKFSTSASSAEWVLQHPMSQNNSMFAFSFFFLSCF